MTNEERRAALNLARRQALKHAHQMEDGAPGVDWRDEAVASRVWADVANAMKDGDPVHDAPDGNPTPLEELRAELLSVTDTMKDSTR